MVKDRIYAAIKEHDAKFADLRFTDTLGKEQHITVPISAIHDEFFEQGKYFDGSSITGWKKINESDMTLMPDLSDNHNFFLDPFFQDNTLVIRCDVFDPEQNAPYIRDPRSLAQRTEAYMRSTGIADNAYFGPEPEFFIFDDVRWETAMHKVFYEINSEAAQWNSGATIDGGNIGHRPPVKGGYFPVPPVDAAQDIRSTIALTLEAIGITVEAHHHEVATGNQCEVSTRFASLTKACDQLQMLKYVVHNVAHNYGKTATFMPKPVVGDNGNGMHCHQSLFKDGTNLFSGDCYAGLSEMALYYIGGIIKHARALNVLTNPTTNSYRRLVPGFEAPVLLAYSKRNRSASVRIPFSANPKGRRIEVRFPDPASNPYLAFSAMVMAGLDGIQNKIHPGDPRDHDLYELSDEELEDIPKVSASLEEAVQALEREHGFLLKGDVFSKDLIQSIINLRKAEIALVRSKVHPIEFELCYSR